MNANQPTTEKILTEALELYEKGISLHSIVRTYPEHKAEIEELFSNMATLSLEKEKIRIPAGAFERMLAALPEMEPVTPKHAPVTSPFMDIFGSFKASSLRYVLPIAALAILTGGIVLQKDNTAPLAVAPASDATFVDQARTKDAGPSMATTMQTDQSSTPTTAPTAMTMKAMSAPAATPTDRMVASFQEEAAYEATIAGRDDADTEKAVAENAALTTDPTISNEN